MNDHRTVVADAEQSLAALAAELTAAAYPIALRHAARDRWLDLQLELWRVLTETIKKWRADRPEPPGSLARCFPDRQISSHPHPYDGV
jgi:hypothetical protein